MQNSPPESGTPTREPHRRVYLFSDESGDLQFREHPQVTKYFAVGTLFVDETELLALRTSLSDLRDELAWRSHGLDSAFHASEDSQYVRDAVFEVLGAARFRIDVTLLEKRKADPTSYATLPVFFNHAWNGHLSGLATEVLKPSDQLMVVAAALGTRKERQAFRSAINAAMNECVPYKVKRMLAFWRDESDFALQAVDYCTWAVTRLWERGDARSYELIQDKICSEVDAFATLAVTHY
jgi:hypothetical protein